MPADLINLNKFRKAKAREDIKQRAEENRRKFGRTKSERRAEHDERARRDALVDGAKRETGDDDDLDPGSVS